METGATRPALRVPGLVRISGGTYRMGSERGRDDERPVHEVEVRPFFAGIAPVTNQEYLAFCEATGRPAPPFIERAGFDDPALPVVGISWYDATDYCVWLSGLTGRRFRLPTEAEREFAALGGLDGVDWPWPGDAVERHPRYPELARLNQPHVPSEACANSYGLMCVAENVHEWCTDWYDPAAYASSTRANPAGPAGGRRKASRGGSWRHSVKFTRLTARASLDPQFRYNDFGFRVYADV